MRRTISKTQTEEKLTDEEWSSTTVEPRAESSGSGDGKRKPDSLSRQMSTPSASPSNDLRESWPQPRTIAQLTSQVNAVSTKLLNGKIDLDTARVYGSLVRSTAQLVGVEVGAARLLKQKPNLNLDATISSLEPGPASNADGDQ